MNKFFFTLAAVTVLTSATQVLAAPKTVAAHHAHTSTVNHAHNTTSNHTHNTHNTTANHAHNTTSNHAHHTTSSMPTKYTSHSSTHTTHGTYTNRGVKFAHGYKYQGKNHNHWTKRRFDRNYNCECYYDSSYSCWYYWCQPDTCYYPVTYCPYRTYCWETPCVQTVTPPVTVECAPPVVTQQVRTVRYVTTNVYRTTCTPVTTVETCLSPPCVVNRNAAVCTCQPYGKTGSAPYGN